MFKLPGFSVKDFASAADAVAKASSAPSVRLTGHDPVQLLQAAEKLRDSYIGSLTTLNTEWERIADEIAKTSQCLRASEATIQSLKDEPEQVIDSSFDNMMVDAMAGLDAELDKFGEPVPVGVLGAALENFQTAMEIARDISFGDRDPKSTRPVK